MGVIAVIKRPSGRAKVWIMTAGFTIGAVWLTLAFGAGQPRYAELHIPWPVLAVLFAFTEIHVVNIQFRRETQSFSLNEIPLVLALFFSTPAEMVMGFMIGSGAAGLPAGSRLEVTVPARTFQELVALARAQPGKLTFASAGIGSGTHLSAELLFGIELGLKMIHVPYKGTGPSVTAVIGNEVTTFLSTFASALPHFKAGRVRALGVTSAKRSPAAPEVPTLQEQGVAGFDYITWYGLLTTGGTPRPVINRIHQAASLVQSVAASSLLPATAYLRREKELLRDGSFAVLDVAGGRLRGLEVVVWPETQTVPGLTAPASTERGRLVLPARPSQPGIAAVEVDTQMVAEKTPDDSTIHLRVGPLRRVKLVQVAENLVLELDEASEIAGFWLTQVPPFPHVEEGV